MLEKPGLPDEAIKTCLQKEYGLSNPRVEFLPLGADQNTAVYRVSDEKQLQYFLKIRHGKVNEVSILLPRYLLDNGISGVITAITTLRGRLWVELEQYNLTLSPYIVGKDAYEIPFSPEQWQVLGSLVRQYHELPLPASISEVIPREDWSPRWRERLRKILDQVDSGEYRDQLSCKLAAVLNEKRDLILDIAQRAGVLAADLQARPGEFVLCHADLHPGNLLLTPEGNLFIVDWDDPVLAPRERDLMFAGGGQGFIGLSSGEEEAWFYRGYGDYEVNLFNLAYYRFERVIIDIVLFAEMILDLQECTANREQAYVYLVSNFRTGGPIEAAYKSISE